MIMSDPVEKLQHELSMHKVLVGCAQGWPDPLGEEELQRDQDWHIELLDMVKVLNYNSKFVLRGRLS